MGKIQSEQPSASYTSQYTPRRAESVPTTTQLSIIIQNAPVGNGETEGPFIPSETCSAVLLAPEAGVPGLSGVGASCLNRQWEWGRAGLRGGHRKWAISPAQLGSVRGASHGP